MPKFLGVEVPVDVNYNNMLAKAKQYLPSLNTVSHIPQTIASYARTYTQKLVQGENPAISQLKKQFDAVVEFANNNFGSSQAYFEDEIRRAFKKQPVNKKLMYINVDLGEDYPLVGDFIARTFPCPEQTTDRDQVAIDAVSEFKNARQSQLELWKKSIEKVEFKIEEGCEADESEDESEALNDDTQDLESDDESSELFVSDDDKKYCTAMIQLITNLSTLHKYAVEFQKICYAYQNDPAMNRDTLDSLYHFYENTVKETDLLFKGLSMELDEGASLHQLQTQLPNEKALLANAPTDYHPSEIVTVKTKPRR